MQEERLQILRMVQEGKVTPEEGAKLLEALESEPAPAKAVSQWLRVRVFDENQHKLKVNVNVPINLVKLLGKFIPSKELEAKGLGPLNVDEIVEMVKTGAQGKLVDVYDDEEGVRVEVYVE
ncbi:MAG: hypothetical protein AB1497_04575 [Bacillota bacterium]